LTSLSSQSVGRAAAVVAALALLTAPSLDAADWPDGARVAVTLTFDLDAETVWWSDPQSETGAPSSLSQGRYGPLVAVPKIIEVLDRHDVPATFFIPAWVIDRYPDAVMAVIDAGHEIGAHGVRHISPTNLSLEEERFAIAESVRVIERVSGKRPVGYRAPSWALSNATLGIAASAGFRYSSNLMDADLPYVHDDPPGMVELPVSWILDDAPYFWFDEDSWNKKIHSAADVEAIWRESFEAAWRDGGYVNLTMHPQIIGRPARLAMLDRLIGWMKAQEGTWFATGAQVTAHITGN